MTKKNDLSFKNRMSNQNKKRYRNKWEKGAPFIEKQININSYMAGIITGFTMGEGSFYLSIKKSKTHNTGYFIQPTFGINLKLDDYAILEQIRDILCCGTIYKYKNTAMYRVTNISDIVERVIPFFDQYPLINIKKDDYNLFKIIVYKCAMGEGKTIEGIQKLNSIRGFMNLGKSNREVQKY
ncbi:MULTISPECIES: LAGLIDADG family homing endonuclease [Peribacillus]|uniref:LAGLIDADG family homing endonuclease n=1 Tax=Peribacillus TaxID=2675229 RepID=UPI001D6B00DD|nr:LAGLIDADG family homing endonuclease [Peribacillus sp. Bi134]WVN13334.1 LAGLIDADG family homing endonuclease [Peribacillus frigoritolerans]CAH0168559.1 hypothetical protein SRABI134_01198 [Peribacillus sp. Bi134]